MFLAEKIIQWNFVTSGQTWGFESNNLNLVAVGLNKRGK